MENNTLLAIGITFLVGVLNGAAIVLAIHRIINDDEEELPAKITQGVCATLAITLLFVLPGMMIVGSLA